MVRSGSSRIGSPSKRPRVVLGDLAERPQADGRTRGNQGKDLGQGLFGLVELADSIRGQRPHAPGTVQHDGN